MDNAFCVANFSPFCDAHNCKVSKAIFEIFSEILMRKYWEWFVIRITDFGTIKKFMGILSSLKSADYWIKHSIFS